MILKNEKKKILKIEFKMYRMTCDLNDCHFSLFVVMPSHLLRIVHTIDGQTTLHNTIANWFISSNCEDLSIRYLVWIDFKDQKTNSKTIRYFIFRFVSMERRIAHFVVPPCNSFPNTMSTSISIHLYVLFPFHFISCHYILTLLFQLNTYISYWIFIIILRLCNFYIWILCITNEQIICNDRRLRHHLISSSLSPYISTHTHIHSLSLSQSPSLTHIICFWGMKNQKKINW